MRQLEVSDTSKIELVCRFHCGTNTHVMTVNWGDRWYTCIMEDKFWLLIVNGLNAILFIKRSWINVGQLLCRVLNLERGRLLFKLTSWDWKLIKYDHGSVVNDIILHMMLLLSSFLSSLARRREGVSNFGPIIHVKLQVNVA